MPFTPAAQRTRSPPVRYHPGARPGNPDGASERAREAERAHGPSVSYLLGSGGSRGRGAGGRRLPLLPLRAAPVLVSPRTGTEGPRSDAGTRGEGAGRAGAGFRAGPGRGEEEEREEGARRPRGSAGPRPQRAPADAHSPGRGPAPGVVRPVPEAVTDLRGGLRVLCPPSTHALRGNTCCCSCR